MERAVQVVESARSQLVRSVNQVMVGAYYELGKIIVEHEQNGEERAGYAESTIQSLSDRLNAKFGKGFSVRNLQQIRKFYLVYSKTQTLSAQLEQDSIRLS